MKVEPSMEQSPNIGSSRRRDNDGDFNLKEWTLKAKISRENTNSRRFSASYIRSIREDAKSFRSNISISSTASSPGYTLREEIDPSTYCFTTALKALQAKTIYSWEYMSPDGLALNSKWNEAEKYICNPLSGEVPLECLSAKTLSGRSFRQLTSRITMSAPLIYPTSQFQTTPHFQIATKTPSNPHLLTHHDVEIQIPSKGIEKKGGITRDVGTQSSTPAAYLSSKSPSPAASTPSIQERSKRFDADESPTTPQLKSDLQVEVKETRRKDEQDTKRNEEEQGGGERNYKAKHKCKCSCLSWRSLCMRQRQQQQQNKEKNVSNSTRKMKKKNLHCHKINGSC